MMFETSAKVLISPFHAKIGCVTVFLKHGGHGDHGGESFLFPSVISVLCVVPPYVQDEEAESLAASSSRPRADLRALWSIARRSAPREAATFVRSSDPERMSINSASARSVAK